MSHSPPTLCSGLLLLTFFLWTVFFQVTEVIGQTSPRERAMTFRAYQECSGNGCPYFVLAQGVITSATPSAFRQFLAKEEYQPIVYFDSPGGNLTSALELGRLIRARGLDTFVGGPYEAFIGFASGNEKIQRLTTQGICFSACAYAFLGGVSREIGERGIYGVHQFFSSDRPLGDATTQVAMTVIGSYLDEMGVNRRLLDLASLTSSRRMSSLPIDIARRLLIDNTEPELATWSVDTTITGKLYAYVVQHQPRRDATVSFMIIRNEAGFVGSILYRINQKFRSVRELNDIFLDESHTFSENVRPTTVANVELQIISNWSGSSREGYFLRFKLNTTAVRAMLADKSFDFDPGFPRVYSDVSPQVTFSSEKLRQSLIALDK
jgi:hypothetical protein